MTARRQLTIFLTGPLAEQVSVVRRRWDPVMAERIEPHVTIVHELDDDVTAFVDDVLRSFEPFSLSTSPPRCWGSPADGIYLPVSDEDGGLAAVRHELGVVEPAGVTYTPHITLSHPRTTTPDIAEKAWAELQNWDVETSWVAGEFHVIVSSGGAWRIVKRLQLGSA